MNIETGVSAGGERRWSEPKRETVVDLAVALGWDPDEALQLVGREPLDDAERQQLAAAQVAQDPRAELDQLWPSLSGQQRRALVRVAATMVDPQARPDDPSDVVLYRFEVADETAGADRSAPTGRR